MDELLERLDRLISLFESICDDAVSGSGEQAEDDDDGDLHYGERGNTSFNYGANTRRARQIAAKASKNTPTWETRTPRNYAAAERKAIQSSDAALRREQARERRLARSDAEFEEAVARHRQRLLATK